MIVRPYVRRPTPVQVGLMMTDGLVVDENGETHDPARIPDGLRVYGSWDTVRELLAAGKGEALCWRGEEIRWRLRSTEAGWTVKGSDVLVLRLPLVDIAPERMLRGLAVWRDWLASHGAAAGSFGSASWSLLRATLDRPLRTSTPWRSLPPIRQTIGGRQHMGDQGKGEYVGRIEQWDMPAAYASCIGGLRYGGSWRSSEDFQSISKPLEWWSAGDRPCFVRAQVNVPAELAGCAPLPRRPRGRFDPLLLLGLGCHFPTGRVQGVWTVQELRAAEAAGCRIVRVLEVWAHFAASEQPFGPWWQAVEQGRALGGVAGLLAKTTGNALWGRFCMDSRAGKRTVKARERGGYTVRHVPRKGGLPPAHDLAETVSGRVRAELYRLLISHRDRVLSAHTDGAWLVGDGCEPPAGWRRKMQATRLELLGPQTLRYTPRFGPHAGQPLAVVSGVPYKQADRVFTEQWAAEIEGKVPA